MSKLLYFQPKFLTGLTGGADLMSYRLTIVSVLLAVLTAGSCFAQGGDFMLGEPELYNRLDLNWHGAGARARAMGGAFVSIVDDASAVTWNPAGLIRVLDPQISFSGAYRNPTNAWDYSAEGFDTRSFTTDEDIYRLAYASFLAPITIRGQQFSGSVAFQRMNEITFARYTTPSIHSSIASTAWGDTTIATQTWQSSTGGINAFKLGFGTMAYNELAFGMSANIYFGTSEDVTDVQARWVETVLVGTFPVDMQREWRAHFLNDSEYFGFSLTFGFLYEKENWRVGATIDNVDIAFSGGFKLSREFDITQADTAFTGAVGSATPPDNPAPKWILIEQKDKIEMPLTLTLGGSYDPKENLTLAADVEWARFGASQISVLDSGVIRSSGEKDEFYTEYWMRLMNSLELRVGGEYRWERESGTYPIRAGFRYFAHYLSSIEDFQNGFNRDRDGILHVGSTQDFGNERATGIALTGGFGARWETIWLDAAVEYYMDSRDVSGTSTYDFTAEDDFESLAITLTFTGFF